MATADLAAIQTIIGRVRIGAEADLETALFADGLGLDSLETAELSAILEDDHGSDPFNDGELPQTVGDILSFYAASA